MTAPQPFRDMLLDAIMVPEAVTEERYGHSRSIPVLYAELNRIDMLSDRADQLRVTLRLEIARQLGVSFSQLCEVL